jgi:tetratricopeptide (TPR) repeat protein
LENKKQQTMKNRILQLSTAFALAAFVSLSSQAQTLKTPAPSSTQTIKQNFGLGDITLEYSRPNVKNRVVFGDLVPFGAIWRTGANASTKLTFTEDVKIAGNAVAAGTYALYSMPNKDEWDFMIYKDLTLGGNVGNYKPENELFRFKAKPSMMANKVETFTMHFADVTSTSTNLELQWDKLSIAIPITTEIDTKIMKNIETSMGDTKPYYAAATYYFENKKDMAKALEWSTKAFENNPKAYWIAHLKAKVQAEMKNYKGAIETAEKSKMLATEDKNMDYVKLNEKLMEEVKKMK